jgi:hypothetical protein
MEWDAGKDKPCWKRRVVNYAMWKARCFGMAKPSAGLTIWRSLRVHKLLFVQNNVVGNIVIICRPLFLSDTLSQLRNIKLYSFRNLFKC